MAAEKLPPDLDSLISLLDDPDAEAFRHVSKQIYALGPQAVPSLEAAWEHAFDPIMQQRIEDLVHHIQFEKLYVELASWKSSGAGNLLKGYLLITRYQYPDIDEDKLEAQVEKIRRDIWLELNDNLTQLEQIKVVNHILFIVYKFIGITFGTQTPENYYLNNLLESRSGTPLSLGMLYLLLAQKLSLPVQGVDLPRHFIVAYTNRVDELRFSGMDSLEIQFYINPFARGVVFTRKELNLYLKQLDVEPEEKYYLPCNNVRILLRLIDELGATYYSVGNTDKVDELRKLRGALEKEE